MVETHIQIPDVLLYGHRMEATRQGRTSQVITSERNLFNIQQREEFNLSDRLLLLKYLFSYGY